MKLAFPSLTEVAKRCSLKEAEDRSIWVVDSVVLYPHHVDHTEKTTERRALYWLNKQAMLGWVTSEILQTHPDLHRHV